MIYTMKRQFKHCQATICDFDTPKGTYTIFYSYRTPKIVKFSDWYLLRFTYEYSRFAGSRTSSTTTSKQCNQRLRSIWSDITDYWKLPTIWINTFEEKFYNTALDSYY